MTDSHTCMTCGKSPALVRGTTRSASGEKIQRMECPVCRERWTLKNGKRVYNYTAFVEIDWRVPAAEGCQGCVHCLRGFCSLGLPEAREPGFVTECEARVVQDGFAVIQ